MEGSVTCRPEELELINMTTSSIVNKICHTPMIQIKDYAARDDASARLDAICDLFGICPDAEEEKEAERGLGINLLWNMPRSYS